MDLFSIFLEHVESHDVKLDIDEREGARCDELTHPLSSGLDVASTRSIIPHPAYSLSTTLFLLPIATAVIPSAIDLNQCGGTLIGGSTPSRNHHIHTTTAHI